MGEANSLGYGSCALRFGCRTSNSAAVQRVAELNAVDCVAMIPDRCYEHERDKPCQACMDITKEFEFLQEFGEYIILSNPKLDRLVVEVNKGIKSGYKPLGGMQTVVWSNNHQGTHNFGVLSTEHRTLYVQTMLKDGDE